MNLVIYARISTITASLDTQIAHLQAAAAKHGDTVVAIEKDDATGSQMERSGLARLRERVRKGDVDGVLVADSTRLTRNATQFHALVAEFAAAGAELIVADTV